MLQSFSLHLHAYYVHNKISVKHVSMALDIKILSSNKTFTYHIASRHANKNVVLPTLTLVFEISGLSLFSHLNMSRNFYLACIVKMSERKQISILIKEISQQWIRNKKKYNVLLDFFEYRVNELQPEKYKRKNNYKTLRQSSHAWICMTLSS